MTIDEAIIALFTFTVFPHAIYPGKQVPAAQLGIEALKRIKASRAIYEKTNPQLLPGETK